jgi:glycosyltransferase involved in cell wall biosynthesis
MNPAVSIVLPVWNGEKFFRQSMASCLAQSFGDLEVIVVDDGSRDSTPALIEEYARGDSRVRPLSHCRNEGLPRALNTGFAAARGKYLSWTSADNYYRPQAMERMVGALEQAPKIHVVYSDYAVVDADGTVMERRRVRPARDLLFGNCVGGCFLYRRMVQDELQEYDENFVLAEDYDFWLRASARFEMSAIHEDLYCARDHEESLSARFGRRVDTVSDNCLEHNLPKLSWARDAEKAAAQVVLARRAQQRGEWGRSARLACSALRLAPIGSMAFMLDSRYFSRRSR